MDAIYHFENVHNFAASEDGNHVIMNVDGAPGICGIRLPTSEIPRMAALALAASAIANVKREDRSFRSMAIQAIQIIEPPNTDKSHLAITLEAGAPPLVLNLDRAALLNFARSVLETAGLIKSNTPSSIQ